MDVLVTYDVSTTSPAGERRLARVAAVCERYGTRVQYSVFECRLTSTALERLVGELLDEIDPEVDSVRIYRFPGDLTASCTTLGRPRDRALGDPWII
ncbi:MAG: CRISPR-associated endonuclease Cas2 [Thermoanaerobacterales bacterium]